MWADLNLIFSEQFRGLQVLCQCCKASFIQFTVNRSKISYLPTKLDEGIVVLVTYDIFLF